MEKGECDSEGEEDDSVFSRISHSTLQCAMGKKKPLPLPGLVVLKLDMKTVFNTDLHLDRVVTISRHDIGMNPDILFLDNIGQSTQNGDPDKVSELDVDSMITLVLLFHILELEIKGGFVSKFTRDGEILLHRPELVMVPAVVKHLYAAHKLDFDTIVLHLLAIPNPDVDLEK